MKYLFICFFIFSSNIIYADSTFTPTLFNPNEAIPELPLPKNEKIYFFINGCGCEDKDKEKYKLQKKIMLGYNNYSNKYFNEKTKEGHLIIGAENGNADAQFYLSQKMMTKKENLVFDDTEYSYIRGLYWLKKAIKNNSKDAKENYGSIKDIERIENLILNDKFNFKEEDYILYTKKLIQNSKK